MKPIVLLQPLDDRVRENRENLICRSLNQNLITGFCNTGLQLLSQVIGMSRDLEIQIVTKQLKELQAHNDKGNQFGVRSLSPHPNPLPVERENPLCDDESA